MKKYCEAEYEILREIADASLNAGEVEIRITAEDELGTLHPEILVRKAPDAVLRKLVADDDCIVDLALDYDGIHILPNRHLKELEREV